MRIERAADGWWIVDVPPYEVDGMCYTSIGPYRTRAEAVDDQRGLHAFHREHPEYCQTAGCRPPSIEGELAAACPPARVAPRLRRRVRSSPGQQQLPLEGFG